MGTPEEWADKLAKRLEARDVLRAQEASTIAMRRQLIDEKLPILCQELITVFDEYCNAYNRRVKPKRQLVFISELNGFSIRPDAKGEFIRGKFNRQTRLIEIRTRISQEQYEPQVVMEGDGHVDLSARGEHLRPSEIVERTFNALFEL